MKKRIILSAGGTGGHLFPAQSLAEALSDYDIRFVAGGLSSNRYFDRDQFSFQEVEAATFALSKPQQVFKGCLKIFSGVYQAHKILNEYKPHVVVGFGSFFTLPVLIAALLKQIPIILHEQNAVPGKVNRLFAPFAHSTAITFPKTRNCLKGRARHKAIEVLFPIRKSNSISKQEILNYFGLNEADDRPILLIFGGSQGAAHLNALFLDAVASLPSMQIIHFTGSEERVQEAKQRYKNLNINAHVKAFESRIDLAMQIADCAIARAGASTVCELIQYKLPALLIPYPFATENHQEKNGEHFVSVVKGGKMYKESQITASELACNIMELLKEAPAFRKNISAYQLHNRAQPLADWLKEFLL